MTDVPSTLDPRGPAAAAIAELWWVMLVLATAVFAVVAVYLWVAAVRRPADRGPRALTGGGTPFVVLWGIAVPAVILTVVMVYTVAVSARTYAPPSEPDLTVEVTGHKFWWEVRYPDHGITTANEIHVPAGEPVRLRLRSADVIHAFWVPQLHGKIDMVPGHTNEFWIQADEEGVYRGICAEYCGIQHARMHFLVVATAPDEFQQWLDARQAPLPGPEPGTTAARGEEVFVEANCMACHAVEGVSPPTDAGPDLTDFAGRRSLAAGMEPNTRERLEDWIIDPQALKQGARMPPTPLARGDLDALLDYLETLRPQEAP